MALPLRSSDESWDLKVIHSSVALLRVPLFEFSLSTLRACEINWHDITVNTLQSGGHFIVLTAENRQNVCPRGFPLRHTQYK